MYCVKSEIIEKETFDASKALTEFCSQKHIVADDIMNITVLKEEKSEYVPERLTIFLVYRKLVSDDFFEQEDAKRKQEEKDKAAAEAFRREWAQRELYRMTRHE